MVATYTTTHEGFAAKRTSARHVEPIYHFAVWAFNGATNVWKCVSYSSRRDLADASARHYSQFYTKVAVAPVECKIRLSKRQRDWLEANKSKEGKTHVY